MKTYSTLIEATDLMTLNAGNTVLVDCRFSLADTDLGFLQYQQGHLPAAYYAHLDRDLSSPITANSGRHPLPDFKQFAQTINTWGVRAHTQVVAYDDAGGAFAARLWWLLKACGHEAVAVLNGGINAWQAAGGELSSAESNLHSDGQYALTPNPDLWVEVEAIEANLRHKDFVLIDARTPERYQGEVEPIDAIAGHIPQAINMPVPNNLEDGKFASKAVIAQNFLALADQQSLKQAVHYCGSGVYACHNILAMAYAGLGHSRLYPGSWSEWIRDAQRPKAGRAF